MSMSGERWNQISKVLQQNGISLEEMSVFLGTEETFNQFTDDDDFDLSSAHTEDVEISTPSAQAPCEQSMNFNGSVPPE